MALAPETGAHVAQTIGPATDGCRTIVLTVEGGDAAATSADTDSSILDGGLDATWIVPTRERRFGRGAVGQATPDVVAEGPATAATAVAPAEPAPVDAAPRRRAVVEPRFHAGGDDAAIARVAAERQAAERRHAERRRRAAEAKPAVPARRRSGPVAAGAPAAVSAPVERHTVRITGTPDPRLVGRTLAPLGGAPERRRSFPLVLNPVAGLLDRPDRLAMWAVLLGIFLVLVAATSG